MHMHPMTTVLLINSPHLNWERLRALLAKQRHAQVVGQVHRHDDAVCLAAAEQPDVIIIGSDVPNVPIIALVQDLRAASPTSRIVVVGKLLDSLCHKQLMDLGVRGFLLWKSVTEETLWPLLEIVQHDICAGSMEVAERLGAADRRRGPQMSSIVLKPLDQAILNGLAEEMTQQQIAETAGVGLRTVEEHIAILKNKLEAPTSFMLGMKAERLGFLR